MLRSLKEIEGYKIRAQDDDFGEIKDFLFDDQEWKIRYLVISTRKFLPGRKVVIPPSEAGQPDWENHEVPIDKSKDQIKDGPSLEEHEPVSRSHEEKVHKYFEWEPYWFGANPPRGTLKPGQERIGEERDPSTNLIEEAESEHLRSVDEVLSYTVNASDGEVGDLIDFIMDDELWVIRYLVVDTSAILSGRKVLLATSWIDRVRYVESKVIAEPSREVIEKSPEFDPASPVNRKYEEILYDYYGRPAYWSK